MTPTNLHHLETDLWEAADQLRANSKLTATEYSMPVLGLIFLRHATNRFETVKAEIEPTLPTRGGVRAPLTKANFQGRSAIYLPEQARYDTLVNLPDSADIGQKIVEAMDAIEKEVPMLAGALPKEYTRFDPDLLRRLLRIFNSEALRAATGDVFGRIYEYFLNKFAQSGAQEGGEYFTPPSIVRTIVNFSTTSGTKPPASRRMNSTTPTLTSWPSSSSSTSTSSILVSRRVCMREDEPPAGWP